MGKVDASWEKVEVRGIEAEGNLNFKYFGLKTSYELGSFDYHNFTDWKERESVTKLSASMRPGSTYNNVFADGSAKLFNVEGNLNGGIFTGENKKYGLGVNLGPGASVGGR